MELSQQRKKTILIAEDDEINVLVLKLMLIETLDLSCELLIAENGKIAVEMCLDNYDIDLVFMDIQMPVLDGITATKSIREFRPDLTVIAVTAFGSREVKKEALLAGCNEFIEKPIKLDHLRAVLNKYQIKSGSD